jgi:predicted transcriptional regulator
VSSETKARIDALAESTGRQIQSVVEQAIADFERTSFFDAVDRRLAELQQDPVQWQEMKAEREELDGALADWIRRDDAP